MEIYSITNTGFTNKAFTFQESLGRNPKKVILRLLRSWVAIWGRDTVLSLMHANNMKSQEVTIP